MISFVIPAYNVENQILRCVQSILCLKKTKIEVIIVDDGSTDNTYQVCTTINDSRVKIIQKKNGGVASARNLGIELATGDYLLMVDGDDYLLQDKFEQVVEQLEQNIDVLMFGYNVIEDGKMRSMEPCLADGIYSVNNGSEILIQRMLDPYFAKNYSAKYIGGKVYQYIIRRNLLIDQPDIRFDVGIHYAEDMLFCIKLLYYTRRLKVVSLCAYQYLVNCGSAAHKYREHYWQELQMVYHTVERMGLPLTGAGYARLYYRYFKEAVNHYALYLKLTKPLIEQYSVLLNESGFKKIYGQLQFNDWSVLERIENYFILYNHSTALAILESLKIIIKRKFSKESMVESRSLVKVAIVTISSVNYGNRLQNYALQEVIKSFGFQVKTLVRNSKADQKHVLIEKIRYFGQWLLQTKAAKFCRFDRNIKKSSFNCSFDSVPEGIENEYTYFVSGSDQVWNPHYNFVGRTEMLYFARPEQKISYAASFGVSTLPEDQLTRYRDLLSDFQAISVREQEGAEIVAQLLGKTATIVLDPTLLIEKSKWRAIERKPKFFTNRKYILKYILGETNGDLQKIIQQIQTSEKMEVIDIKARNKHGKELAIGPSEFLYLIDHAECILTNSFHAMVFSILFHKPIYTFNRLGIDMSSRILSLANILGMQDYLTDDNDFIVKNSEDYVVMEKNLDDARKSALTFLRNALIHNSTFQLN